MNGTFLRAEVYISFTWILAVLLNNDINKLKPVDNRIYILGDFNIDLFLNDSYILGKNNILNNKSVKSDVKNYHEFCKLFGLK